MNTPSTRTITYALLIIIVTLGVWILIGAPNQNGVIIDEVLFTSSTGEPVPQLSVIKQQDTFLISPVFFESSAANPHLANAMNLYLVVLTGNDKNAVQLLRVYNAENTLEYCATNFGDTLTQVNLTKGDCEAFIERSKDDVKVFIELPNEEVNRPTIDVAGNSLTIKAKTFSDLGETSFTPLRFLFPNAQDILDKTNIIASQIG
jgi:hypothetical protein